MPCLYIYGDESGVFDQSKYKLFIYGGILFRSKKEKEAADKAYRQQEERIRNTLHTNSELKASTLNEDANQLLLQALNPYLKYALIIDQNAVSSDIFRDKKTKQRYLDYVFENGLRETVEQFIGAGLLNRDSISAVSVAFDNHTTATNNTYELTEGLETEFALGSCDFAHNECLEALFPAAKGKVGFRFGDSKREVLIRAADVVCHHVYTKTLQGQTVKDMPNLMVVNFPENSVAL